MIHLHAGTRRLAATLVLSLAFAVLRAAGRVDDPRSVSVGRHRLVAQWHRRRVAASAVP